MEALNPCRRVVFAIALRAMIFMGQGLQQGMDDFQFFPDRLLEQPVRFGLGTS